VQVWRQATHAALGTGTRHDVHFVEHAAHGVPFVAAEVALALPRAHQQTLAAFGNAEALGR